MLLRPCATPCLTLGPGPVFPQPSLTSQHYSAPDVTPRGGHWGAALKFPLPHSPHPRPPKRSCGAALTRPPTSASRPACGRSRCGATWRACATRAAPRRSMTGTGWWSATDAGEGALEGRLVRGTCGACGNQFLTGSRLPGSNTRALTLGMNPQTPLLLRTRASLFLQPRSRAPGFRPIRFQGCRASSLHRLILTSTGST
jgi:hypothetical protein